MNAINIPIDSIPPELKSCEQILRRAKELKNSEPVITYWCCFSAAQAALSLANRSQAATTFLMSLLDVLEEMKAELLGNEAVTSEAAGSAFVENFALRVFLTADNADRAGDVGKNTVRKFVVAGQFIEVLKCFESGLSDDMDQKLQYARWKAADLAKALREGRQAKSGPPQPPTPSPTLDPFPSHPTDDPSDSPGSRHLKSPPSHLPRQAHTPSPGRPPSLDLPSATHTPPLPPVNDSDRSGHWSNAATPGVADESSHFKLDALSSPKRSSPFPSPPVGSPPIRATNNDGDAAEKKNVRFAGPDGAPLSPAATVLSLDSYATPSAPPPSEFSGPSPIDRPAPSAPTHIPSAPAQPSVSNLPPPPPPSLASYPTRPPPAAVSASHGLGLSSPPPPPPTPHSEPASVPLTRKQIEQTQKHARWAISALEFDDVDTARLELKRALALLG